MGENQSTSKTTEQSTSASKAPIPLTFGDFSTQACGAWAASLINAQNDIAKMGADIARNFTNQQKVSFDGQETFLTSGLKSAYSAAEAQYHEMMTQGFSSLAGGLTSVTMAVLPGVSKLASKSEGLNSTKWGDKFTNNKMKQLHNAEAKLVQQKELLKIAHETTPQPVSGTVGGKQPTTAQLAPTSAKNAFILDRKNELLTTGGNKARELSSKDHTNFAGNGSEEALFKQRGYDQNTKEYAYDSNEKQFYRKEIDAKTDAEGAKLQQQQVSKEQKTVGAYHFDELDKAAIEQMNATEHADFIKRLDDHIATSERRVNTLSGEINQSHQNQMQLSQAMTQGSQGIFQFQQASYSQHGKQEDAQANIANQEAGVSANLNQSLARASGEILNHVAQSLQGFSQAFGTMGRG